MSIQLQSAIDEFINVMRTVRAVYDDGTGELPHSFTDVLKSSQKSEHLPPFLYIGDVRPVSQEAINQRNHNVVSLNVFVITAPKEQDIFGQEIMPVFFSCLLYTSPSPRDS